MATSYRHFPHPVLSEDRDDYINSKFLVDLDIKYIANKIRFTIEYTLENEGLEKLLKEGKIEVVYRIESPQTMYRTIVKGKSNKVKKIIDETLINGNIKVSSYIIAKQNIKGYRNELFHDDYKNLYFDIDKTAIIAIGEKYRFRLDKDMEELYNIPSIFVISRSGDKDIQDMSINFEGDKINIILSDEDYVHQQNLGAFPVYQPVLHSMIIMPALIYLFTELKEAPDERIEELSEKRWFKSIDGVLRKMNLGLEKYYLEYHTPYKLAQMILDNPINRALNALSAKDEVE